jgi:hypothetical protein
MKVLNLRCAHQHLFEGWFASEADYAGQLERGLLECPLCADKAIIRLPSSPRLNLAKRHDAAPQADTTTLLQTQWMRAVRHVLANTEDVGERFPEEARRIHYGEIANRGIRGRASREDTDALRDEGIEVMALPVPAALKEPLQ